MVSASQEISLQSCILLVHKIMLNSTLLSYKRLKFTLELAQIDIFKKNTHRHFSNQN